MFSTDIIYALGLFVSALSIALWIPIILSQIKQFNADKTYNRSKTALLVFGIASLCSNFVPIWYDIFRLTHGVHPDNIFFAYITSSYLYRLLTALMFFILYRY